MQTIFSKNHGHVNLSDEIYEVLDDGGNIYPSGTRVRKIAGVNNSKVPGHHWSSGWTTICSLKDIESGTAAFLGIKAPLLKVVEPVMKNRLIHVTQKDIEAGVQCNQCACMVAHAIKRVFNVGSDAVYTSYASSHAFAYVNGLKYYMSAACMRKMDDFDKNRPVKPFSFRMRFIP